jgi:hypothetical protein
METSVGYHDGRMKIRRNSILDTPPAIPVKLI